MNTCWTDRIKLPITQLTLTCFMLFIGMIFKFSKGMMHISLRGKENP